jgi:hypothetical protein
MLRRRRPPDDPLAAVDPRAVAPRFGEAVAAALDARRRYGDVLAGIRPGPVREQLAGLAVRVDAGVLAVWETARRATDVARTLDALDPDRVTDDYKRAKRSKRAGGDPRLEAVQAQRFGSVQRLLNTLDDTDERLRLLDARLGAVVAGAAEVALGTVTGAGDVDALGAELDGVVDDLGALRAALDELG